jgi:hypothetical protein
MEARVPRTPREALVAEVEVSDLQSGRSVVARTADISMGGCFVETSDPFSLRAAVTVKLTYNEVSLTIFGDIVRSEAGKGMAIRFRALEPNQTATLKGWFFSLDRAW